MTWQEGLACGVCGWPWDGSRSCTWLVSDVVFMMSDWVIGCFQNEVLVDFDFKGAVVPGIELRKGYFKDAIFEAGRNPVGIDVLRGAEGALGA